MASQKNFRVKREEDDELMQKFNNLMIDNSHLRVDNDNKTALLKQVT